VISLFISLTETVLGIGVIQTSGGIQIALTVFVIVFPLLVASAFFVILWNRNYVFYSPSEYGQQDVRQYVEAMQQNSRAGSELFPNIENIVRTQLSSSEIVNELTEIVSRKASERMGDEISNVLASVADKTLESIKDESFITIDSRPLVGSDGQIWQIPYNQYSTVSELLDNIWYLLSEYNIPSLQYGTLWALRDLKTKNILKDMGRIWASKHGQRLDTRNLSDVGFMPGIKLEAIKLT
jgi:hypothetical protein